MRRKFTYASVWAVATALAVTASWLAVRPVLRSAAFGRPSPVPLVHPSTPSVPSVAAAPPVKPKKAATSPKPSSQPTSSAPPPRQAPSTPSNVKSYTTLGGRVALVVHPRGAELISSFPNPGYEQRITEQDFMLRIDFITSTAKSSSVIAVWHAHDTVVTAENYE